jgi:hypothetical protein
MRRTVFSPYESHLRSDQSVLAILGIRPLDVGAAHYTLRRVIGDLVSVGKVRPRSLVQALAKPVTALNTTRVRRVVRWVERRMLDLLCAAHRRGRRA